MTYRILLLDSAPLGLVSNPRATQESVACKTWLVNMLSAGHRALVPAIIDYEVRRELLRAGKTNGLRELERIKSRAGFLSLTDAALLKAAEFWAMARQSGLPTADRFALDADAILAGQAATLDPSAWDLPAAEIIVATTNVGHLTRFVTARKWQDILP